MWICVCAGFAINARESQRRRVSCINLNRIRPGHTQVMKLHYSWSKRAFRLSSTARAIPEQLLARAERVSGPYWLSVEGVYHRVLPGPQLALACELAASYHNSISYNAPADDGFARDMAQRELRVINRMLEAPDESDTDSVTSAEDQIFEREFYI